MRRILAITTLVLCIASSGFGQDVSAFEIYGGGAYLREPQNFNRYGWVGSVTGNVNEWFGIKGEVSGYYNDGDNLHTFLGGPQFTLRRSARIEPWAHFLAGLQHNDAFALLRIPTSGLPLVIRNSHNTYFALQPGGGFDISLTPRVGLRFGADYVRALRDFGDIGHYRAHAGVVFKLR